MLSFPAFHSDRPHTDCSTNHLLPYDRAVRMSLQLLPPDHRLARPRYWFISTTSRPCTEGEPPSPMQRPIPAVSRFRRTATSVRGGPCPQHSVSLGSTAGAGSLNGFSNFQQRPVLGTAIAFFSTSANPATRGVCDPASTHMSTVLTNGTKFVLQKWYTALPSKDTSTHGVCVCSVNMLKTNAGLLDG